MLLFDGLILSQTPIQSSTILLFEYCTSNRHTSSLHTLHCGIKPSTYTTLSTSNIFELACQKKQLRCLIPQHCRFCEYLYLIKGFQCLTMQLCFFDSRAVRAQCKGKWADIQWDKSRDIKFYYDVKTTPYLLHIDLYN